MRSLVARLKALPTDDEIAKGGFADAGQYVLWLQSQGDGDAYEEFCRQRDGQWGGEPPQPYHRCVAHLLTILLRSAEDQTAGSDDLRLTEREASAWVKGRIKRN